MAQSDFVDPPQAQGYWTTNVSKMAVLFWKWVTGQLTTTPAVSITGQGAAPAPAGFTRVYTYFGATNNLQTVTYRQGSTVLGKVTFTYIAGGVADDDDIATEVWTAN